jgi:hypothetical protein
VLSSTFTLDIKDAVLDWLTGSADREPSQGVFTRQHHNTTLPSRVMSADYAVRGPIPTALPCKIEATVRVDRIERKLKTV